MSETPVEEPTIEEPAPEPPPEEPTAPPQTTSDLLKIQRALSGDDSWAERLKIGFMLKSKPDTTENRLKVTFACVAGISCTVDGTVSTEGVTDDVLLAAIETEALA